MNPADPGQLSKREQQVMDVVFRLGSASAQEVREAMASPPSYSAVRALLAFLEDKVYLKRSKEIGEYLVRSGVAGTPDDVNGVLLNGFYHLYGPVNDYV